MHHPDDDAVPRTAPVSTASSSIAQASIRGGTRRSAREGSRCSPVRAHEMNRTELSFTPPPSSSAASPRAARSTARSTRAAALAVVEDSTDVYRTSVRVRSSGCGKSRAQTSYEWSTPAASHVSTASCQGGCRPTSTYEAAKRGGLDVRGSRAPADDPRRR